MATERAKVLINWVAVITYSIVIWIVSASELPMPGPSFAYSDKLMHLGAFAVLAILFFRAYGSTGQKISLSGLVLLSLVSSMMFGVMIEVNQSYLPHRRAEAMDLAADFFGSSTGVFIYLMFLQKRGIPD